MKKIYIPIAVLSFLVIAQLITMVSRIDIWPFSSYAMFSESKNMDNVQAYRLKATKNDGSQFYIELTGNKDNWLTYEMNTSKENIPAIEKRMKMDLQIYLQKHQEVSLADLAEVHLVRTSMKAGANGHEPSDEVLHSFVR